MSDDSLTCPECGRTVAKLTRTVCARCYNRHWQAGTLDQVPHRPKPPLPPVPTEKPCAICSEVKPLDAFHRNTRNRDGRGPYCKPCAWEKYGLPASRRAALVTPHLEGEQECRTCRESKPVTAFYWRSDLGRYNHSCIECRATTDQAKHQTDPALRRAKVLRQKYGLSLDEFNAMLAAQGGGCAICSTPTHGESRSLAVDHCHATGRVRGILCGRCNRGIGLLRDDPALLRTAANYVEG